MRISVAETIDAPPRAVFGVITDLERYAEWNPWIVRAAGVVAVGNLVRVTSQLGARRIAVRHRILVHEADRELRWCDVGWFTRLAYGERARFLEPRPGGGAAYRCELTITGIATRLAVRLYGDALAAGLAAETAALKQRAETMQSRYTQIH